MLSTTVPRTRLSRWQRAQARHPLSSEIGWRGYRHHITMLRRRAGRIERGGGAAGGPKPIKQICNYLYDERARPSQI